MKEKVRPLSRQELQALAVTDADAFTANRFLRHRETTPSISELEEKGREALPGIEGSLLDLYHTLWSPDPSVKEEVPPGRRYWQEMLKNAMATSAFKELHAGTELRELQSVLGTISMGESVVGMVSKEDKEKLAELSKAQQASDEAEADADGLEAEADALQSAAEKAAASVAGQGAGEPSGGKAHGGKSQAGRRRMTPEQAQEIANELAKQVAEAAGKVADARQLADAAKAEAEAAAEALLGKPGSKNAKQKLRELAQIGQAAIKTAQAKVEEVSKTIEAWGLDPAELSRKSIPEALGLLERMKRSAALKKFAALLGRIRSIAAKKARSKTSGEGRRVSVTERGRDIRRAARSEKVALTNPALRPKALNRWTRGELRLQGEKTEKMLGHGPVIVCEDGSGSMDGDKQQWAKAIVLSLAHYAKLQRRSFGWVMFDSVVHRAIVYPQGIISPEQMLEIVEARAGGGTSFEAPLRKALEMVKQAGLKKADICFITDGECAVSETFVREFNAARKALEINVFTVLCDAGSSADPVVQQFSDKVEKVSTFSAEEAEAKLVRHL